MKEQFPQSWKDQLETLGFDAFTEIQEQIFSPIYEGENVLGISPTGTGKTLAYLFPSLLKLKPKKAQQLLILAPNKFLMSPNNGQSLSGSRHNSSFQDLVKNGKSNASKKDPKSWLGRLVGSLN